MVKLNRQYQMDIDPLVGQGHNHRVLSEIKLGGTNYTFWQFKMTTILDSYKLLDTMIRIDAEPMGSLDPENPTGLIPPMRGGWEECEQHIRQCYGHHRFSVGDYLAHIKSSAW